MNRHQNGFPVAQNGTAVGTKPAQKRGRKDEHERSKQLALTLPEGIEIGTWRDGRRKPYYVRFGSDRRVTSFFTEQDRNDAAEKLAEKRSELGTAALDIDPIEWRKYQEFRKRCPAPLHELEQLWLKDQNARQLTVKIARDRYLALFKGTEPGFAHIRLHLKRLVEAYGPLPLADITHDMLRDLNERLRHPKTGKPLSDVTKFDHRKNWNGFFQRCVQERLISFNPCDLFVLSKPVEDERDILTAKEIFSVLKANRDQPVIGRMAFELFGALRSSSAARLTPDDVKRSVKGIRLPGAKHKSGKVKFRQGHPNALWAWYDHAEATMWDVSTGVYDERKREAFIRAHAKNPGNVLRSSCLTYLLAFTNNPPLVARLAQHTSLKMLEIYEGVATEEDAKLVMAMTPDAVLLSWEDFQKKHAA